MKLASIFFSCITFVLLAQSCKAPVQEQEENNNARFKKSFLETNSYIRERHRDQIMAFSERLGWEMNETPTGLWYMITGQGEGAAVQKNKMIYYAYETRLLNGTICYVADTIEPKKVVVGKGNIEAGLEEGLLLLSEGSKARFIIPPYLAHGNFGDMKKVPGSSILLIEVEVLEVKR
jgi:FKBP-type peptidyl-prolyl cis-trans isomerase FkpA